MVRKFFFGFLILCLYGCADRKLTTVRHSGKRVSSFIRMDGYYKVSNNTEVPRGNRIFFLYENGIVYGGAYLDTDKYGEGSKEFFGYLSSSVNDKTSWGVYVVDDKNINIEKWEPSSGGPLKTVIMKGKILDEMTFVMNEMLNSYDGKTYQLQDTFRFQKFHQKPDSTNRFFK